MVVSSHAKCRDCGTNRHRIARFNICQECWEKVKPSVRREWRRIKDRRRLQRAVDEHVAEQQHERKIQAELLELRQQAHARREGNGLMEADPPITAEEAARLEIARIKAEGVPPAGSPERGKYMHLWAVATGNVGGWRSRRPNSTPIPPREDPESPQEDPEPVSEVESEPEAVTSNGQEPPVTSGNGKKRGPYRKWTPELKAEIAALYDDPAIPLAEIQREYHVSGGQVDRIRQEYGIQLRSQRPGYQYLKNKPGRFEEVDGRKEWVTSAPDEEEPVATAVESNVSAIVLPATVASVTERAWAIGYVVTRVEILAAPSLDEAIRRMREKHGEDIDITSVQRT